MNIKNTVILHDNTSQGVIHTFTTTQDIAIEYGDDKEKAQAKEKPPLVRLHSQCFTGETLQSAHCDCKEQMDEFISLAKADYGFMLYLFQEGRGIGLHAKLDAYALQQKGIDTFEANRMLGFGEDERNFDSAVDMLKTLGITQIRLHTNNPEKVKHLRDSGIDVTEVINTKTYIKEHNEDYLRAKKEKHKHNLDIS